MSQKFVRVYRKYNLKDVKEHLLVYGDVSGQCARCDATDIKLDASTCPACNTAFKHVSFRNIKTHMPKVSKLFDERPHINIIDFDDYKKNLGTLKAEEFLK